MNMRKLLWWRFQQCSGTFTMLLAKGFSQTGLFRHLSDYVFRVRNFKITKSMRDSFLPKCSNFHLDFKITARNIEKVFCFLDNCIWIGSLKLSLLRRGYLSSATNVLTTSPNIWHVNNRDFFKLNWLGNDQWIWWRSSDADLNSAWAHLPCCLSKGSL